MTKKYQEIYTLYLSENMHDLSRFDSLLFNEGVLFEVMEYDLAVGEDHIDDIYCEYTFFTPEDLATAKCLLDEI